MKQMQFSTLILAAGKGTRMKSDLPKVLHKALGRPLIAHVMDVAEAAGSKESVLILGHGKDHVLSELKALGLSFRFVVQEPQKGTGHAVQVAAPALDEGESEIWVILTGDCPLVRADSIQEMVKYHLDKKADFTVGTMVPPNSFGYGRIVLKGKDTVADIVEEKDATDRQRKISLVAGGVYVAKRSFLKAMLPKLVPSKLSGETYLTKLPMVGAKAKRKIVSFEMPYADLLGVNDMEQMSEVEEILRWRLLRMHMKNGVRFTDPKSVYLESGTQILEGTVIEGGVTLKGETRIGKNCRIESGCYIESATFEDQVLLRAYSYVESSILREQCIVGPFARIRPESDIGAHCRIGNFVEIKKSTLHSEVKAAHLAYVGDAEVGERSNLSCGFITVNYDGVNKHQTKIGKDAFLGSDVQVIAPIEIGDGAFVAGGSTITKNVPAGSLAIARAVQENKEGYADKLKGRALAKKNAMQAASKKNDGNK